MPLRYLGADNDTWGADTILGWPIAILGVPIRYLGADTILGANTILGYRYDMYLDFIYFFDSIQVLRFDIATCLRFLWKKK